MNLELVIFLAVLVLFFCALAILIFLPKIVERRIEKYQNKLATRQFEEIRNTYKEMRGWRHDYRNHMQVLKVYLENGQLEKCKSYLLQMDKDLNDIDQVIKTGNVMADAILNSKLSLARTKEISLNVTARVPENIPISDTEFCVIFGNLMDNAIEACEKLEDTKKRFVRVYIGMFKKQFYISVSNATIQQKRIAQYITEKGAGHGFGLYRIDNIVKKHKGYLNRKNEPGVFVTELMLPFVE